MSFNQNKDTWMQPNLDFCSRYQLIMEKVKKVGFTEDSFICLIQNHLEEILRRRICRPVLETVYQ